MLGGYVSDLRISALLYVCACLLTGFYKCDDCRRDAEELHILFAICAAALMRNFFRI
jgi:hypothetical protein